MRPTTAIAIVVLCSPAASAQEPAVTYADVSPLLNEHCGSCHRPGGDAPFELVTPESAWARRASIAAVVQAGYMPPWKPDASGVPLAGRRRLSADEARVFQEWARSGVQGGEGTPPAAMDPWPAGPPDAIITLPAFRLPADGGDVFRNFVVGVPTDGARVVRGLHFRPRSAAVHHANIRIDPTPASRRLDEADPESGYEGVILRSADFPDGHFLGWTPGQMAPSLRDELAWSLPAGADLVVQVHLRPTGAVEHVSPEIGIYFGRRLPPRPPVMVRLSRQDLRIPPGARGVVIEDAFVLPAGAALAAMQPHAHTRARSVEVIAEPPDAPSRLLLKIGDWDFRWQDRYVLREPLPLPARTGIRMRYTFDNAGAGPAEFGWRTSDEMADVWLQFIAATDADRRALAAAARAKMQREDAVGSEVLVARQPSHVALRNDAAMLYMAMNDPASALKHFAAVTRLEPHSAAAHYNEGVARAAMNDLDGAAAAYQRAIDRQPDHAAAHNNLGAVLMRQGRWPEALASLQRAVALDRANADAQINLATAHCSTGNPDACLTHIAAFGAIAAERIADIAPLLWRLIADRDASKRRPVQAGAWAARLVATSARAPAALDLLAAAQAAQGDFRGAVDSLTEALARAAGDAAADRAAMTARLARYRAGRPFLLP